MAFFIPICFTLLVAASSSTGSIASSVTTNGHASDGRVTHPRTAEPLTPLDTRAPGRDRWSRPPLPFADTGRPRRRRGHRELDPRVRGASRARLARLAAQTAPRSLRLDDAPSFVIRSRHCQAGPRSSVSTREAPDRPFGTDSRGPRSRGIAMRTMPPRTQGLLETVQQDSTGVLAPRHAGGVSACLEWPMPSAGLLSAMQGARQACLAAANPAPDRRRSRAGSRARFPGSDGP